MRTNKLFNICNIYIILWCVYNLHRYEILPEENIFVSKLPLGINLIMSIYYFFKVNYKCRLPIYLKGLNLLLVMFVAYGVSSILLGGTHIIKASYIEINNASYIVSILRSLLPIYAFYYFAVQGYLTEKSVKIWALIFVAVYFVYYYVRSITIVVETDQVEGEFTNNIGYLLITLLPGLLLFKEKKIIFLSLLLFVMILVALCMKRGAIIIGIIVSVYMLYIIFKHSKISSRILLLLSSVFVFIYFTQYIGNLYEKSEYFQERVNETLEGDTSGRGIIVSTLLDSFKYDTSVLQVFFGKGADATLDIAVNYAHNDWLEILINQGILGVIVFMIYWICFYRQCANMCDNVYKNISVAIFIIYMLSTFFSMSYNQVSTFAALLLGFSLFENHNWLSREKILSDNNFRSYEPIIHLKSQ